MLAFQRVVKIWNSNEYSCRNYIPNTLDDSLYHICSTFNSTREIWESLETKYKTEVACSKRFMVGKFLNFKMSDAKSIVKQVEELQVLVHELDTEGVGINPNFLVGSIIEKLPHSWRDFKLYLKHLTEDMSFGQLVLKLRVEDDNRKSEKTDGSSIDPNANFVGGNSSKPKFQKFKHKARDYRLKRDHHGSGRAGCSNQANMEDSETRFVGVVEANFMKNEVDWWLDTGATRHICNSKDLFSSYVKINDGGPMFMGNSTTAKVQGKGKVILKLTSGKVLEVTNVLHVSDMSKNLISGPMLSNKGFKNCIRVG
ncbi:uncharacterized protein LOC112503353 [Cynara cardunculus var. scolymus]|uniref:uncharacterized protein LOC112503353 n=1 Tax=Cynara cardunculus var. scolymus TaxID=59895 RepID=UPI000D6291F2|nr:uncharacterized protein LOC112503353 [Cynara cardunculus var. scolymus]